MIRIISGIYKGRRLKIPAGWSSRPTADRVKEALFNILAPVIAGSVFLDLFAGSGNVGLEALSRGAAKVFFIEQDPRAVKVISANLLALNLTSSARVIRGDVVTVLKRLDKKGEHFDIVFLDPPYERQLERPVLKMIGERDLLKPSGVVIVESSKREVLPARINNLVSVRQEKYGDTMLTFFKKELF